LSKGSEGQEGVGKVKGSKGYEGMLEKWLAIQAIHGRRYKGLMEAELLLAEFAFISLLRATLTRPE
jgi:hypothetical protein